MSIARCGLLTGHNSAVSWFMKYLLNMAVAAFAAAVFLYYLILIHHTAEHQYKKE
ncbi:MAG: hypothetical protein IJ736_13870 [Firmicutes bacterium]|nr:hypothetical protein [Bacillota bacterium]